MLKKVADKVWKLTIDSNLYFLDFDQKIIIDTGNRMKASMLKLLLPKVVKLEEVEKVIFTHLHYDHIGNLDLFPNAKVFASKQAIKDLKENPELTVLDADIIKSSGIMKREIRSVVDMNGLKMINTPGHTRGSISIWYEKEKILFSGDTFFGGNLEKEENLCLGRTDLPDSDEKEMKKSLEKIKKINYKILCPGHDYC